MRTHPSRRQILGSALASSSLLSFGNPRLTFAEGAAPTPQCHENHEATNRQTEGPFFKPSSPERADLVEPDTTGRLVEINGLVMTRSCRPVERTLVDLWHADEHGEYDNAGFRYRGQPKAVTASVPFYRPVIQAAPATITSKYRLRSSRCSPPSCIFQMNPRTAAMLCSAVNW